MKKNEKCENYLSLHKNDLIDENVIKVMIRSNITET
jgi:hypothetical protein